MKGLIAIAVFLWCMATLLSFVFATDPSESFLRRIGHSIRLDLRRSAGLKVIPSMLQAISIYWVMLGVILNRTEEAWFKDFSGEVILWIMIGAPILAAAIIAGKRKDKGL
jgi:hypothetical protein